MSKIEIYGWVLFVLGLAAGLFGLSGFTSGDEMEFGLGAMVMAAGVALANIGFLMILCGLIHKQIEATGEKIVAAVDRLGARDGVRTVGQAKLD